MLKGFTRNFQPLELLTEEQVEAIHRATLHVLDSTGMRVEHDEALKLLKKNGCRVDFEERRVRFPPSLVEDCLVRDDTIRAGVMDATILVFFRCHITPAHGEKSECKSHHRRHQEDASFHLTILL